jgi:diguanylate cyclase (GGDEF)-like protein
MPTAPEPACLVVLHTVEPTLFGQRFLLEVSPFRLGRKADSQIRLEEGGVSARHAHLERRDDGWVLVDDGSSNGTCCNDEYISREVLLQNGDRISIGRNLLTFLSGADLDAQYHEEIRQLTLFDGLTRLYNERSLYEALEREIARARDERDLALVLFELDPFQRDDDSFGRIRGDFVLRRLARVMASGVGRENVLARVGGEQLALVVPHASLASAVALAEALRAKVGGHVFWLQSDAIRVTLSAGVAVLAEDDQGPQDLVRRALARLFEAKERGRDQVGS